MVVFSLFGILSLSFPLIQKGCAVVFSSLFFLTYKKKHPTNKTTHLQTKHPFCQKLFHTTSVVGDMFFVTQRLHGWHAIVGGWFEMHACIETRFRPRNVCVSLHGGEAPLKYTDRLDFAFRVVGCVTKRTNKSNLFTFRRKKKVIYTLIASLNSYRTSVVKVYSQKR